MEAICHAFGSLSFALVKAINALGGKMIEPKLQSFFVFYNHCLLCGKMGWLELKIFSAADDRKVGIGKKQLAVL